MTTVEPLRVYAWSPAWAWPLEGPFTTYLKFVWANAFSASESCRILYGRGMSSSVKNGLHGRTFLGPAWARTSQQTNTMKEGVLIANSGLDKYLPKLFMRIASDRNFRFCPCCLAHGYQSALFQIDALTICPIHKLILQNVCSYCKVLTPRYAITEDAAIVPFHCNQCGHAFGEIFNPCLWRTSPLKNEVCKKLLPIVTWLRAVDAANLHWTFFDDWMINANAADTEQKRTAAFSVLRKIIPDGLENSLFQHSTKLFSVTTGQMQPPKNMFSDQWSVGVIESTRASIYKSIRRHLLKHIYKDHKHCVAGLIDVIKTSSSGEIFLPSLRQCAYAQAFYLWRIKCEGWNCVANRQNYRKIVPCFTTQSWPIDGNTDDSAWGAFIFGSYNAARETVHYWWLRARTLKDPDIYGTDRSAARTLVAEFAEALRTDPATTASISIVMSKPLQSAQSQRIFIVGPASSETTLSRDGCSRNCS